MHDFIWTHSIKKLFTYGQYCLILFHILLETVALRTNTVLGAEKYQMVMMMLVMVQGRVIIFHHVGF